jgi:hypothetical protein
MIRSAGPGLGCDLGSASEDLSHPENKYPENTRKIKKSEVFIFQFLEIIYTL